jgi:hypothetical protein
MPRSFLIIKASRNGNQAEENIVSVMENKIIDIRKTAFVQFSKYGDDTRSIIVNIPNPPDSIRLFLCPNLLDKYAKGIIRRQLDIPCAAVVVIDNIFPAPSMPAKRMITALSRNITDVKLP